MKASIKNVTFPKDISEASANVRDLGSAGLTKTCREFSDLVTFVSALTAHTFSPLNDTMSRGPYMNLAEMSWSVPSAVTLSFARWLAFKF